MCKCHQEINERSTISTNKNQHAISSMQKNPHKKFFEQNQFHDEKNQYASFTKRKINM